MNSEKALELTRECLKSVCPDMDIRLVNDDTPLLQERIITSFQVIDLIIHLENKCGRVIQRRDLQAGSFRDIATIAKIFFQGGINGK